MRLQPCGESRPRRSLPHLPPFAVAGGEAPDLIARGESKPAWYEFNAWSDGEPEAVSVAQFPAR